VLTENPVDRNRWNRVQSSMKSVFLLSPESVRHQKRNSSVLSTNRGKWFKLIWKETDMHDLFIQNSIYSSSPTRPFELLRIPEILWRHDLTFWWIRISLQLFNDPFHWKRKIIMEQPQLFPVYYLICFNSSLSNNIHTSKIYVGTEVL